MFYISTLEADRCGLRWIEMKDARVNEMSVLHKQLDGIIIFHSELPVHICFQDTKNKKLLYWLDNLEYPLKRPV